MNTPASQAMICILGVALALGVAAPAAAAPPGKLDLSLPPELPAAASTAAPHNDPKAPGVYYGDHSGISTAQSPGVMDAGTDTRTHIHGSVGMGIGYASGLGTGTTHSARLHIDKTSDSGNRFDVDIGVSQVHGFDDAPWGRHHGH